MADRAPTNGETNSYRAGPAPDRPAPGVYRLLIEEFEYISANHAQNRRAPGRLTYAEIIEVDAAMVQG
jgi:hypothetical protein